MGTFNLAIDSWDADPGPALAELTRKEEKCGFIASHGYGMLKALCGLLDLSSANISGGVLELPDGTDSITIAFSMHTGRSDLSYRDRVMKYLKEGTEYGAGQTAVHGSPISARITGGTAPDHPADVPPQRGDERPGQPDPGTTRGMGPGPDTEIRTPAVTPDHPLQTKGIL